MSVLKLSFLGSPLVELDGAALSFDTRKAVALLAYLTLSGPNATRETLAALLFPEYQPERAYANLRRTLWTLNRAGLDPWLDADVEQVALACSAKPWVDVEEFHRLIHGSPSIQDLEAAAALYRGDLLAGFSLKDSPAFDDWHFFQAETLRQELASVLERLSEALADQAALEPAITHARRWVSLDPLHEPAQRWLMRLYTQGGHRAAAIRQYQECAQILHEELGAEPEAETQALYAQIRKGPQARQIWEVRRPPVTAEPAVPPRLAPAHNLPVPSTPFVGRQRELEQIQTLLADPNCRLLTLLGPGGIGKTRLAIRAAGEALQAFPDGICFVPLEAVPTPELLPTTILQALRASGLLMQDGLTAAGDQRQVLLGCLRGRQMLLVMDNFEHLLPGAACLSELLAHAPWIKILVTSRERLALLEEWVVDVGGLDFPEVDARGAEGRGQDTTAGLERYSAVMLFLQAALRARPDFRLTAADAPHVVRICQLAQGLPLGIELAAAWLRVLPCQEIAAEIECNLDLLSGSLSNIPERHRSLRAVFDSSWQRLAPEEQEAFERLTIFRNGFDRTAAIKVAGADLAVLSGLLDRSWVRRRKDSRFEIHELLRQYGGEKLDENTLDGIAARDRHSRFHLERLAKLTEDLKGRRQREALSEIRQELDNVRAAWEWAVERQDWDAIAEAAECLWIFCFYVSAFAEGERTFGRAAERLARVYVEESTGDVAQGALLGCLLTRQGAFSLLTAQFGLARELLERGSALCQRAGDQAETAFALNQLGNLAYASGDLPIASSHYEESLAVRRGLPDRWSTASSLYNLGSLLGYFGQYEQARRLCEESLASRRIQDDRIGLAFVLGDLGSVALRQGDLAEARRYFTELQGIRRELPDDIVVPHSYSHGDLSDVAYLEGDYVEAERLIDETLASLRRVGNVWNIPFALGRLALIRCAQGDYKEARTLLQESLGLARERIEALATAHLLNQQGHVLAAMGDCTEAERCHQRSLDLARERSHPPEIAAALAGLAQAAYGRRDYERAKSLCNEAVGMFVAMGARLDVASLSNTLGDIALVQREYPAARQHLDQAWQSATHVGAMPLALAVQVSLAELTLAEGAREIRGTSNHEGVAGEGSPRQALRDLLAQPLTDPRTGCHVRSRARAVMAALGS